MSCGFDHRVMAAVCVGGAAAADWKEDDHWAKHPLVAAATAAGCGTLPDIIEPALHPNHRQFFHSVLFAAGVGAAERRPKTCARRRTCRRQRVSDPFGDGRIHAEVAAFGRQALRTGWLRTPAMPLKRGSTRARNTPLSVSASTQKDRLLRINLPPTCGS